MHAEVQHSKHTQRFIAKLLKEYTPSYHRFTMLYHFSINWEEHWVSAAEQQHIRA